MVDRAKLDQMLSSLGRYLAALESLASTPREIWEVDDERVHQYLQEPLADLGRFARQIANHAW